MQQRENHMERLADFIAAWGDPAHADNNNAVQLMRTPSGNINSTGLLGDYSGDALSPWHPQFYDSLEKGVRELVSVIISDLRWMTYTSCEGHRYRDSSEPPVERHVGILPRTASEMTKIQAVLGTVAKRWNCRISSAITRIELLACDLHSETGPAPVIDLFFRKRPFVPWRVYFGNVNSCCAWVSKELRVASARGLV